MDEINIDAVPHETMRTTSAGCEVHLLHKPLSHVNHKHHIWPQGLDGPTVPENIVVVCATGHWSIHQLLSLWIKANGDPGKDITKLYTRGERKYAELGYRRYVAKSLVS